MDRGKAASGTNIETAYYDILIGIKVLGVKFSFNIKRTVGFGLGLQLFSSNKKKIQCCEV
jgi:hypothetical protein